jgi:hypothetical protein
VGDDRGVKSIANVTMMDDVLLLVSGVSGAGKSSVREGIAATLAPEVTAVELGDLDTIPQTRTLEWRQRMAERAVLRAQELDGHGRHLLLAGDPVAPGEVVAAPSAPTIDIAVCLLDIDETAQRERLRRHGDPEENLPSHVAFADWMRRHACDPRHMPHVRTGGWQAMRWSRLTDMAADRWRISVIDGSNLTKPEANQAVLHWVIDAIEGRAPGFKRPWKP